MPSMPPAVEYLVKGKAHKPYEFGVKGSVATTQLSNFIIWMPGLAGNPYDGHTIQGQLQQVKRLTGQWLRRCVVDQGYWGNGIDGKHTEVLMSPAHASLEAGATTQ